MTAARTAKDLEYRYQFSRAFAEVMGICDDARRTVEATAKEIEKLEYELSFRLAYDENDKIVSMLNASADIINIKGNRLSIESTNFYLSEDGSIVATSGYLGFLEVSECEINKCTIDDCVINDTCTIKGTLVAAQIHAGGLGMCGIGYDNYINEYDPIHNWESYSIYAGGGRVDVASALGGTVSLYGGVASVTIETGGIIITSPSGASINGDEIVTESGLTEIYNRLKALEEAQNGSSYDDCDHVSNLVTSGATETVNVVCPTCNAYRQSAKTTYVCSSCNAAYRYIYDGSCGHTWVVDSWA
jgi:hypothetical protein